MSGLDAESSNGGRNISSLSQVGYMTISQPSDQKTQLIPKYIQYVVRKPTHCGRFLSLKCVANQNKDISRAWKQMHLLEVVNSVNGRHICHIYNGGMERGWGVGREWRHKITVFAG